MSYRGIIILIVVLVVGLIAGIFIGKVLLRGDCSSNFKFINEELRCEKTYVIKKHEYIVLKNNIITYLNKEKTAGHLTRYGVYFRDLDNGPTFGIDEKENFIPASLLKLPLMLTYFKLNEEDPFLLDKEVNFNWQADDKKDQFFKPSQILRPNASYSIEELVFRMIAYSDNASYFFLLDYLKKMSPSEDLLLEVYHDIGVIDPASTLDSTLSPKSYASLFRLLYNTSYLSKESSEKALDILSQSDFKDGLVAGVPAKLMVAHKFGERFDLPNGQKELHDCGIVYYPGNPYLLCVMTKGYDWDELADIIAEISRMVYAEIESRKL
jgi:beta-lactamase class A